MIDNFCTITFDHHAECQYTYLLENLQKFFFQTLAGMNIGSLTKPVVLSLPRARIGSA
jgi:hypothetical protein